MTEAERIVKAGEASVANYQAAIDSLNLELASRGFKFRDKGLNLTRPQDCRVAIQQLLVLLELLDRPEVIDPSQLQAFEKDGKDLATMTADILSVQYGVDIELTMSMPLSSFVRVTRLLMAQLHDWNLLGA